MTKQEIIEAYSVDGDGICKALGKFEDEPAYVPWFWFNDGLTGDDDLGAIQGFIVRDEDRATWPGLLDGVAAVILEESEQGFVCSEEFQTLDSYHSKIAEIEESESEIEDF